MHTLPFLAWRDQTLRGRRRLSTACSIRTNILETALALVRDGRGLAFACGVRIDPAESGFHLAAHSHGDIVFVACDVAPFEALVLRYVAPERDAVRESE